ncbi:tetratricopeptide repeat protein [Desulfurivibrio sp. D14AmB]|uniref:tetratricopeptide repeat protein n=1 Tax=Desulfurivibrio sp. D14AmB TaxID=3374370 RepID=UPI00376F25D3
MIRQRWSPWPLPGGSRRLAVWALALLLPVGGGYSPAGAAAPLVPEREIVLLEAMIPAWKLRWDEARSLVRQGRLPQAAQLYEELLAGEMPSHQARWELARVWQSLGEHDRALQHFELLWEANPENSEYNQGLAFALLATGRFGRSAELLAGLLSHNPQEPRLLAALVEAQLAMGNGAKALPALEKLVGLAPDYPGFAGELAPGATASESLARLYRRLGQVDRARDLSRRLAEPVGADPSLLILAADIHEELGLRRQAAAYWRRVVASGLAYPRAAARLDAYLLDEGHGEEALSRLLPRLAANPDDHQLLRRTAQVYLGMTLFEQALPHLENYLELNPTDRESLLLLLDIYNALHKEAEALVTLERLLALEGETAPDKLIQAALLYEERGEKLRALELYGRVFAQRPGEPRLLARQLRLLQLLGRDAEVREIMARSENARRAADILAAWHQLDPDNHPVTLSLALVYLEGSRLAESAELLAGLERAGYEQPQFFWARALLRERQQLPYAAWQDYERLLLLVPQREEARRRALVLAVRLGLPERVAEHSRHLAATAATDLAATLELVTARIEVLDLAGAHQALIFLQSEAAAPEERVWLLLAQARLFAVAGLVPEAEQALRLALLEGVEEVEVYRALFELALAAGRPAEAVIWLTALEQRWPSFPLDSQQIGDRGLTMGEKEALPELMRVRLGLAEGDYRQALRLLRRLPREGAGMERLLAAAVGRLLSDDLLWQAESLLQEELLNREEAGPEALILAALVSERRGRLEEREDFLARAGEWALLDPGRVLALAEILARYGLHQEAVTVLDSLAEPLPRSLRGGLQLADSLTAAGRKSAALAQLDQLLEVYPDLFVLQSRRLRLLFEAGRLDEVVELADGLALSHPWAGADLALTKVHALWMQRQWQPALNELAERLTPTVNARFAAAAEEARLSVPADEPPSPWGRLAGAINPLSAFIDKIMTPVYAAALQPGDDQARRLAAPLYAEYRRQQRFAMELQARQAVERREFFAALRAFERLAQEYPDEGPLLYDLAGLYSRLERLEPEAAIYRQLTADQVQYPGLTGARLRNELKRQPRSSLHHEYRREEGRDGHKALVSHRWTASHWLAPYLGHEFDLAVSYWRYRDPDTPETARGRQAELLYRRDAFAEVDLLLGIGAWGLNDGPEYLLGRAEIAGDFGDRFWGRLAYRRQLVEDTLEAVRRGIRTESYSAAAVIDLLPRLEAGASYGFLDYSDGNRTHGYDLWAGYTIFTDPTLLSVRYIYDFKDSSQGAPTGDHPYWAPANYWRKLVEFSFRHQLSDDPFLRDIPRYYTLRYATIYDSDGYAHQELAGSLFLEWSPKLILEAGVELSSAPSYRRRQFSTTLTYRW